MFRTISRLLFPNPFDALLKRAARKGKKTILLCWNRGLGDIALGLYAMVERIRHFIPEAHITFATRENLRDGFSLLEGVNVVVFPEWKRGQAYSLDPAFKQQFDLVIEKPSPTDWVQWQRGKVVPKLRWNQVHDALHEKFAIEGTCVGVQVSAETNYGLWRNWPFERWGELFSLLEARGVKAILFGFGDTPKFSHPNVVDLRGKTTLFELLSIVKHRLWGVVLPDSGISSVIYYLDVSFPLRFVSLWADPNHGILKQAVISPNPQLTHCPLIGGGRDLSTISAHQVIQNLFPAEPLTRCLQAREIPRKKIENVGAILLAGGQGTRLNCSGSKGLFSIGGKTLFEWLCRKSIPFPIAVMTSPLNHEETVAYFEKNHFFGLEIHFFQQELLPLKHSTLQLKGPNGNGSVFRSFARAGLREVFAAKGIDFITVSNIENPLSDLFDAALIQCGQEEKADAVVQCIERGAEDQHMGVLVERTGRIEIVEYTELDPLKEYKYAYTGQIGFSFSFFSQMGEVDLPLHWVQKKIGGEWVLKGEQFIFDALPYAQKVKAVCAPRKSCYAPIKHLQQVEQVEKILREKK